jgi:tRNA modification GTPase
MFSPDDSIVAIATPPGRGGIGVVRISGPSAPDIAAKVLQRTAPFEPRVATFVSAPGVDEAIVTHFPAPHSYTGQHVIEISAHGNPVVLDAIVRLAIAAGARLAEPGEFTLRAFLNGKRDLIQAEAVGDLIAAATPLQARVAFDQLEGTLTRRIAAIDAELYDLIARLEASLDFPDEGYHFIEPSDTARRIDRVVRCVDQLLGDAQHGRMIREGATVVIAGRPNVGKSSLFNALAGNERAIVTEIAGTTRDLVTERIDLQGLPITLVDTAGWRETSDIVEREGVARASKAREVADLVLVVLDSSAAITDEDTQLLDQTAARNRIIVANKIDLAPYVVSAFRRTVDPHVCMSAVTGAGVDQLRASIVSALRGRESLRDTVAISNTRHIALINSARASLIAARDAASADTTPEEFLLTDLQAARAHLDEIVGVRTSADLLEHIFANFCIGK